MFISVLFKFLSIFINETNTNIKKIKYRNVINKNNVSEETFKLLINHFRGKTKDSYVWLSHST